MRIYFDKYFWSRYRTLVKKDPSLRKRIKKQLEILKTNPLHPSLRLHKLQGKQLQAWSISVGKDLRILFVYVKEGILLVNIGKHEEVY